MSYKIVKPAKEIREQLRKNCNQKERNLHLKDATQLHIDPQKFTTIRGADQIFKYEEK